jgi:hypothetical protein
MDTTKFKPLMDNFNPGIKAGPLPLLLLAVPFNVDTMVMDGISGGIRHLFYTPIAAPSKAEHQPLAHSNTHNDSTFRTNTLRQTNQNSTLREH